MEDLAGARIVVVYTTKQARDLSPRTGFSLALEAMKGALDDADMTLDEVDGFGAYVTGLAANHSWAYQLKKQFRWTATGQTGINSMLEAARLITSGYL